MTQLSENTLEVTTTSPELDVSQTVVELDITTDDNQLTITSVSQTLEVQQPDTHQLVVDSSPLELELTPDAMVVNQTFTSGGEALEATAGEALGGHRAVYIDNGQAFYASASDTSIPGQVVGITTQAAAAGGSVNIRFVGALDEAGWSFAPGPVYVGINGVLTQTRPTSGWVMNIGVAVTPTRLLINKTMTIEVS